MKRLFRFTCPNDYDYGRISKHDTVEFIWDGIRNAADGESMNHATLYDSLMSGKVLCRECRNSLHGGEVPVHRPIDNDAQYERKIEELTQAIKVIRDRMDGLVDTLHEGFLVIRRDIDTVRLNSNLNKKQETTMVTEATPDSKIKKLGNVIKSDMGEMAWRVGASQAIKTAKAAVIAGVLKGIPKTKKDLRKQITAFFSTPYGDLVVGLLISGAISMSGVVEGSKRDRLAKELRVGAMTGAANEAMNAILDPLRGFFTTGLDEILDGMPETVLETGVRVDASNDEEEDIPAVVAQPKKAARA